MTSKIANSGVLQRLGMAFAAMTMAGLLAACGGGSDAPPAAAAPAAAITAQPTDQSAVAGSTATFSVTATNATGYQWQRSSNGGISFTDVTGAVSASQTTAAVTPADSSAQYRVVVSGAGGNVTSSAATLTVTAAAVAPSITVQPAPQTITAGQDASFSVTATGTALTYQWQHSRDGGLTFTDEAGATAATLTLTAVAQLHNGHFLRVVVSNSLGSVTSTAALLTVNAATAAAAITQHPTSQSVTAPAAATFSAVASGLPTPTLQWQVNVAGSWSNIIGATSASYTTPATAVGDSGKQYRVMATNATGNVTSNAATLTVSAARAMPAITTQPASVTIIAGQNAQFTVAASGSPPPSFQWQLSLDNGTIWSNIIGETGAVFSVNGAAQPNNGRQFRAVASNSAGSVNSNAATLTVNAAPPASATTLVSVSISGVAANNISGFPSMSADGNLVAFTSIGTDLVAGFSATDYGYAYLRNRTTGVTSVINQTPSGTRSSRGVGKVKLAAGGNHAVFTSVADDLVAGAANGSLDVYLRNLQTGTTTQLNLLPDGTEINQPGSPSNDLRLSISADGRWVTFISGYDLLGNGAPSNYTALFLRDTTNNVTKKIASDSASQVMGVPEISSDGRSVVYPLTDFATSTYGLMRYDTQSGSTSSLFTATNSATSYIDPRRISLSNDGRYVSFSLRSVTLIGGAAATYSQVVVLDSTLPDTDLAKLTVASTGAAGAGDGPSLYPVISGDGRYVIFNTFSPVLTGDPAATIYPYLMVRDRTLGTTQVASRRVDGSNVWLPQTSDHSNLSSDGTVLMFVADVAEMRMPFTAGGQQVFAAPRP